MTTRIPVVLVNGQLQELPASDKLALASLQGVPVYISQTDPAPSVPYIWFVIDVNGVVTDIQKGP
jgi:hypothetical protein